MKALVFDKGLHLLDVPMPIAKPGEVLVRVLTAGVCNTDIEICRGYMNYSGILGHEFVGVVEQAQNNYLIGKRVVGEINCVCHQCRFCDMEMPHHCINRTVVGIYNRPGVFSEYAALPEENLHIVPDTVPDNVAVFTEPLAAAFRITEQIDITPEDRIIVLGDGKLGQLVSQTLRLYSRHILCVGRHAAKMKMLSLFDIPAVPAGSDVEGNADIVVDATGKPEGLHQALSLVRPEGTIVLKTTSAEPLALESSLVVVNEVRILGSRCGPFRPAIEALAMGTVEPRPMITATFPLADAVHAMNCAQEPGAMKVLLNM